MQNGQVLPDFALANWTHFLVFSASSFAEASVPASHLRLGQKLHLAMVW
jgi:hypothetical protein